MKIILFTVPKVSKVFEVRQFEEISMQNIEGGSLEMCHVFILFLMTLKPISNFHIWLPCLLKSDHMPSISPKKVIHSVAMPFKI